MSKQNSFENGKREFRLPHLISARNGSGKSNGILRVYGNGNSLKFWEHSKEEVPCHDMYLITCSTTAMFSAISFTNEFISHTLVLINTSVHQL